MTKSITFAVAALLFAPVFASADIVATIFDNDGILTANETYLYSNMGDTNRIFTIYIEIDNSTSVSLTSAQMRMVDLRYTGAITFISGSLFYDGSVWDTNFGIDPGADNLAMDTSYESSPPFGIIANDLVNGTGTSTNLGFILALTFQIDPYGGQIDYHINLTDFVYGDTNFALINDVFSAGQDYITHLVPAPGAFLLGSIGMGLVGWIKRSQDAAARTAEVAASES